MLCIQILPRQDAFVMEDTVPKIADVLPAFIELRNSICSDRF